MDYETWVRMAIHASHMIIQLNRTKKVQVQGSSYEALLDLNVLRITLNGMISRTLNAFASLERNLLALSRNIGKVSPLT